MHPSTPSRTPTDSCLLGRVFGLALILSATASTARADFKAQWLNAEPDATMNLYYDANGSASGGGTNYNGVLTGQYNWQWKSGDEKPGNTNANNQFWTYCIELTQYVNNDWQNIDYTLAPLGSAPDPGRGIGGGMGTDKALLIQELFEERYATNFTDNQAAAFQLAIWEIIFEHSPNTWDVKTGDFRLNYAGLTTAQRNNYDAIAGLAADMLGSVADAGSYAGPRKWDLMAMTSPDSQDQVVMTPTPAPPGVVLALSGLLPGVVFLWRRRAVAAS